MKDVKSTQAWLGAGVLTAIGASLCCITPVMALISGASGLASSLYWMEPFRPYLIAITLGVLGFAWYRKLKPKISGKTECACEDGNKPSFFRSALFLSIVTVFAVLMLTFPYYGQIFYPHGNKTATSLSSENVNQVTFKLRGMDCASCEAHIKYSVSTLPGIFDTKADFHTGIATVRYDRSKINENSIAQAIDRTGYQIVQKTGKATGGSLSTPQHCSISGCK